MLLKRSILSIGVDVKEPEHKLIDIKHACIESASLFFEAQASICRFYSSGSQTLDRAAG
jgi:hypothetical protein